MIETEPTWWVIDDYRLRFVLKQVESGDMTKEEAYAYLQEYADDETVE